MSKSHEYKKFTAVVDRLLAVPHEELQRRQERYREQAAANPNKRGPKPKAIKPSASRRGKGET